MSEKLLLEPHAHTAEVSGCSRLPARQLVALLKENGYFAVVITDHYQAPVRTRGDREAFAQGYLAALEAGRELGITVLPGMELRYEGSWEDYLVYLPDPKLMVELPGLAQLDIYRMKALADELGLLIYQAHPYRPGLVPAPPGALHGMEVHNGHPDHDSRNHLAQAYAQRHGLHRISGSDLHEAHGIRQGGIWVPPEALSPAGFVDFLRRTPEPDFLQAHND